ncbi:excinuclease ABC subunit UvrC [Spiribacter vilamensis]|uniref:UvrABC system protein C n=1 Tax=Spiribacter vilamensis TaxID=531306 RepID=A0A4Q8CZV2_9GAMM|nr:excinuclease ABC subunit UvrC [Spiribacter vilamensis]RZU98568.1 excinuclease ABC subunit C [Spiribacter vilamensis]TVO60172.1 excinuclease ABC subunit UvrC [Spiribacter vilamensis]
MSQTNAFDPDPVLKTLPTGPGVYRMFDADATVIYVGKARNLKRRVSSYFRKGAHNAKTQALVGQVADLQVTVTHTEAEALILENNLIKEHRPRYNVLLRDDKTYPYIYLSTQQDFPRLGFHRGQRRGESRYFGPFPSSGAVRETLNHLQKVFPVRQCRDSFYRHRTRPCLQYQIGRCTAPCVGYVSEEDYAKDVRHVEMFLSGQSSEVVDELVRRMEAAAEAEDFELAARLRDRITSLRRIQERQYVSGAKGDVDVIACRLRENIACVQVFVIRDGQNLGNQTWFPRTPPETTPEEILYAFIARHYLGESPPGELLVSHELSDGEVLAEAISNDAGYRVGIASRLRGERRRWLEMAQRNADHALSARMSGEALMERRFEDIQQALALDEIPERIECFDISHTRGEATVASCVVMGREGPIKDDYRRFNIEDITGGDDYAAMHQALERRFKRLSDGEGTAPDVLLIDGGQGQLRQAEAVLEDMQIEGVLPVGISKGPRRKPGEEVLLVSGRSDEIRLAPESPGLHLLQQVRDEAHRFAITGHRNRRGKARQQSSLEEIPGLGAKRRQALMKQFGGLKGIKRAGVEDLSSVQGISTALAERIHGHLNG